VNVILRSAQDASSAVRKPGLVSAWDAVLESQQQAAPGGWLIAQPDHAALAGDLAQEFAAPPYPLVDGDVIRAFRLHDAGWADFDGGGERGTGRQHRVAMPELRRGHAGRPLSFFEIEPKEALVAWSGSIERALEASGPIGGLLVSGHFWRLARSRLEMGRDSADDTRALRDFLVQEESRQAEWLATLRGVQTREHVQLLTDLLQFCDLLSLYLCCGSVGSIEFPQTFEGRKPVLRRHDTACVLDPSPFTKDVVMGVEATRDGSGEKKTFEFLLR
jgi:hypothetical protein